jgi:hypothetical protein
MRLQSYVFFLKRAIKMRIFIFLRGLGSGDIISPSLRLTHSHA